VTLQFETGGLILSLLGGESPGPWADAGQLSKLIIAKA